MITKEALADLSGVGAYDEQRGRIDLVRWHAWPDSGKGTHMPFISCWCRPGLIDLGEDGHEFWQHHSGLA